MPPDLSGWAQTLLTVGCFLVTIGVAWGSLSTKVNGLRSLAQGAVKEAETARLAAANVEREAIETKVEFLRAVSGLASDVRNVRTILDERLPKSKAIQTS